MNFFQSNSLCRICFISGLVVPASGGCCGTPSFSWSIAILTAALGVADYFQVYDQVSACCAGHTLLAGQSRLNL